LIDSGLSEIAYCNVSNVGASTAVNCKLFAQNCRKYSGSMDCMSWTVVSIPISVLVSVD